MRLARTTAAVVLLQGFLPLLVFGAWRPGGWFLLVAATIYAGLAYGLWTGKRWSLPLGFVLTLPQLLTVSSWLFSWRFFVGASTGLGFEPALNLLSTTVGVYFQFGSSYFATWFGYDTEFASSVVSGPPRTWVCINAVAVSVLCLLIRLWRAAPNHALQRTGTGVQTGSEQPA